MSIVSKGLVVAAITLVADQLSKMVMFDYLREQISSQVHVLPVFNLVMVWNYGVSFGMFNTLPFGGVILSLVALGISVYLLWWLFHTEKLYICIALGLIIGGAFGNIIDRIRFGAVADFLDFHWGEYHWPAFNIADSAVVIGVAIILIDSFLSQPAKVSKP